jgi:hypothetical protein
MSTEKLVEQDLSSETEILGENPPLWAPQILQRILGSNPGRHCVKPVINRLSYGMALPKRK